MPIDEESYDQRVGRNIQELRKARGITQAVLADGVSARGHAFRQQTVVKIEKGQRPLRLVEADAVAAVLEVDVDDLIVEHFVLDNTTQVIHQTNMLTDAWEAFVDAGKAVTLHLDSLKATLNRLADNGAWEGMSTHVLGEAAMMMQIDLEATTRALVGEYAAERQLLMAQWERGVESKLFDPEEWRTRG